MSNVSRRRCGLSLVEALVSVALVATAIVAVLGALAQMTRTDERSAVSEYMERLAAEKFDEILATGDYNTSGMNGDFSDRNLDGYSWRAEVTPTSESNLNALTITVDKNLGSDAKSVSVVGLIYSPTSTTTGSTTNAATPSSGRSR